MTNYYYFVCLQPGAGCPRESLASRQVLHQSGDAEYEDDNHQKPDEAHAAHHGGHATVHHNTMLATDRPASTGSPAAFHSG